MANKKIRELEEGSVTDNDDLFIVATANGDTVKVPYSTLATFLFGTSLVQGNNITIADATQQDGIKRYCISATSTNTSVTLAAANWVGASAPYTQTVTVQGMTSSIVPIIGLVPSATVSTGLEEQTQWGYVTKAESGANSITFSCYETKPTVDLMISIKVV